MSEAEIISVKSIIEKAQALCKDIALLPIPLQVDAVNRVNIEIGKVSIKWHEPKDEQERR